MSDIRFRAWDIENKRWMTPEIEDSEESELRITLWGDVHYRLPLHEQDTCVTTTVLGNNMFDIMRGTGLNDIDGTYIWEGDIATDEDGEIVGVIEMEEGNTYFNWENISELLSDANNRIRVIGNIREDKHLLN